jgi:hypothetical protein
MVNILGILSVVLFLSLSFNIRFSFGWLVRALYDWVAQSSDEISFKENDIIEVTSRDAGDGWYEGEFFRVFNDCLSIDQRSYSIISIIACLFSGIINGRCGHFPANYVEDYAT